MSQPPIPGTVLLFTPERLSFEAVRGFDNVGHLEEPEGKYLIIDGQHRLAALHFYRSQHPDEAQTMHVPCVIFDGKSEDFATEMFVIINSTPTRINKSHLVDLYERVSWAAPDRKFAARVVEQLYSEGDSPLRYKINRLGGRSQQEKWILQAELFNEIHRWATADWRAIEKKGAGVREVERFYERVRDFLKAAEKVWGDAWGNGSFMVTKAGHPEGHDPRLRRPQPRGRRAGRRPPEALGAPAGRLARAAPPVPGGGLLRALPGQGPDRARGPGAPRAEPRPRDRAAPGAGRSGGLRPAHPP